MTKLVDSKQEGCQWCLARWYHCPRHQNSEIFSSQEWRTQSKNATHRKSSISSWLNRVSVVQETRAFLKSKNSSKTSTRALKGRLITRSNIDSQRAWFLAFYFFDSDFQPGESTNYLLTAPQKGRAEKPVLTNAQTALQMSSLLLRRNNQGQWGDSAKTTGYFSTQGDSRRANYRTS